MLSAEKRIKVKLFKRLFPWYAFFFGSLLVITIVYCIIANSLIGMIPLFISFVTLRYSYHSNITYHADHTNQCIPRSILLFLISGIPLILLNMRVSLLSSVPVAIIITYILYQLGLKNVYKKQVIQTKHKPFDLDNCTEEELIVRCRERFTRDVEYKTERAIKHFILKLPHDKIDVNPQQSKIERYRMRQILK